MTITWTKETGGYKGAWRKDNRGPWKTFECLHCWKHAYEEESLQRVNHTEAACQAMTRAHRGHYYDHVCTHDHHFMR